METFLDSICRVRYVYFPNTLPRKGMETLRSSRKLKSCTCFPNTLPRKGMETLDPVGQELEALNFPNTLPRKGMETLHNLQLQHFDPLLSKHTSPKGDGNLYMPMQYLKEGISAFQTHFPERGWKRCTEPQASQFIQLITNCRSLFKN